MFMVYVVLLILVVLTTPAPPLHAYTIVPLPAEYPLLQELALGIGGIGAIVALLFFIVKQTLSSAAKAWFFNDHPWLVNLSAVILSIGISFLGAWMNAMPFDARSVVSYIWKGVFSAAVATLGYEFTKNAMAKRR